MIFLMLRKNWGAGHLESINALTHWISAHPKEIPCYVVGCESTIPNENVQKYVSKVRDDAIRDLCNEVLLRSKTIGVRGKTTYKYLTEVLQYKPNQVDIIYESGSKNNATKLRQFLQKNESCLIEFENEFLEFQRSPRVMYERPIKYEKNIVIGRPFITVSEDSARLSAEVLIDGKTTTLWCETQKNYRQFLLSERSDAFLSALVPLAMRSGKDIVCEAPVTEQFLHNLNEILIPHLSNHDLRLHRSQITATGDASILVSGNAVATGMSCGVDSFYTVSLYLESKLKSMNLTHLYTGNYIYGNEGEIYERAELVAKDLRLPLVRTRTNINEELKLPHLYTHFFKTMFGVLALRKLFRTYYYSTAEDFSHFDLKDNGTNTTAAIELLLLYTFSCFDFNVVTGGAKSERPEKTRAISDLPAAQKFLNVCLFPLRKQNCGKCEKCRRTLLTLDMAGFLENFREVFDIDEYLKTRLVSLRYLARKKDTNMMRDVYRYFVDAEPLLMKQAEEQLLDSQAPSNPVQ